MHRASEGKAAAPIVVDAESTTEGLLKLRGEGATLWTDGNRSRREASSEKEARATRDPRGRHLGARRCSHR